MNVEAYVTVIAFLCCEQETSGDTEDFILADVPLLHLNQTSHEVN